MASLRDLRARFQRDMHQFEQIRQELREQTFEGCSEDGRITVTVRADGRLEDLDFDPRAFRSPVDSNGIAEAVLRNTTTKTTDADDAKTSKKSRRPINNSPI